MKKDEVPEEEEGGGRQMQKETDFVRKACVHEPRSSAFTDGGRNPHFSSTKGGLLRKSGLFFFFFGAKAHNYHLRGARAPQWAHSPRKNGNFSSSVKVLSSSSSRLLLSQTPGAAHTETSVVDLLS